MVNANLARSTLKPKDCWLRGWTLVTNMPWIESLAKIGGGGARNSRDPLSLALRDQLTLLQYSSISASIAPLYLTVAALSIGAALAAQGDFPLYYQYLLPGLLLLVSAVRFLIWRSRRHQKMSPEEAGKKLKTTARITAILCLIAGLWALSAFYDTHISRRIIAVFFISMSAFAVSTCLASLPRAAVAAILLMVGPVCIATLMTPDLGFLGMGISLAVVSVLQMRLVRSKYSEMVKNLALQQQLQHLAQTDPLTGLDNRRAFTARLESQIETTGDEDSFAIAMVDLDGFKRANDRYGHSVGDEILVETAKRLKKLTRAGISVARLGGDEFALIFPPRASADWVQDTVAAIRTMLAHPYIGSTHVTGVSASIGLSWFRADGKTLSELLKVADAALYAEKAERGTERDGYRKRRGGQGKKPDVRSTYSA